MTNPDRLPGPIERRLRDYQCEDTEKIRCGWARGLARIAIVWATGLGKSDPIAVLAVEAARRGEHVWLLAHRSELLNQLRDRCHAYAPDIRVGRVQAASREHDAPIVVTTVQTVARLVKAQSPRLVRPNLIIVDECHHAAAETYERIMAWAGCYADIHPTRALGVTATLDREEKTGLGLGDVWQEVVAERGIVWGIDNGPDPADPWTTLPVRRGDGDTPPGYAPEGWLVPLQGLMVVGEHVDLARTKISRTSGDYADNDLGEMVAQDAAEVVKAWYEHAALPDGSHRQTGVFVPTINAAEAYLAAFLDAGVDAELVTGKTSHDDRGDVYQRTGIYGRVADGRTTVLVSVGVLTEGWDCPPISCILVARPTILDHLYQQMVGRGTRPMDPAVWLRYDGTPFYPKRDCLVMDVVGMTRHVSLRTLVKLIHGVKYRGRPCVTCGRPRPCGCPAADPADDGSEDYTGGLDDPPEDNRRQLVGPADYTPVDLLADARDRGLNWLITIPQDGYVGIPFLKAEDLYGLLWANEDGSWTGGWVTARGAHDGDWIIESVTFEEAREAVETLRIDTGDPAERVTLADLAEKIDQPWRRARKRGSPRQQAYAESLGIVNTHLLTAGALGDEIERVLATRRLVRDF